MEEVLGKVRVQKILSENGFCSRRKAEALISNQRVRVNGRLIHLGDQADPFTDKITVDGEQLHICKKKEYKYLMLYKPRGYVTTMADEQGRRCVADLVSNLDERVFPVGRLDVNSEGLLLLTNDGNFANQVMHPSRHITKVYRVTIRPDITEMQAAQLSAGVMIDGRLTAPARVTILTKQPNRVVVEIAIHEGRNRQVRKMIDSLGLEVARLKRTSIGPLKLGMLKPGRYRDLTKPELLAIRSLIASKASK